MTETQTVKLGEVAEFRNGVNFSQSDEGSGLPILKVKDFGSRHTVPVDGLDELDRTKVSVPQSQLLAPDDIVIIPSNGNREMVGRSMIYAGPPNCMTFSGFCGAYPAVRPDVVMATNLPTVPPGVVEGFSTVCAPLVSRIEHNKKESRTLAAIRNLLLPKLMSGKIRLRDTEREVAA